MEKDDFERLNGLSEKALNEIATPNEMKEFNRLLNEWNLAAELNVFANLNNQFIDNG